MQILLIAPQPFFQWRGSPIRVRYNAQALSELGHQVTLLTLPMGEKISISGVEIIRVPNILGAENIPIGPSFQKAVFDLLLLWVGLQLARKRRYDIIHAIEETGVLARVITSLTGCRHYIYEKHSDPSSYKNGWVRNKLMALYGKAETFAAAGSDAVICTGPGLVEQVKRSFPRKRVHHIFDIPSSLKEADGATVDKLRSHLKKEPDEVLVTYVGSFAVYQGVDLFFNAIPLVLRQNGKARFVIIGGSTEEIGARRLQMAAKGADQAVTFLGKISPDELPDYLSAADILAAPRLAGVNTPLKVLDYFKAGRAIVATDVSANRLILDETCALFANPNPSELANAIGRLIDDGPLRQELGRCGRQRYQEKFNFGEFKSLLQSCYNQISLTVE